MKYYLGAYYLVKLSNIDFGSIKDTKIHTCSACINDFYFDSWSLSWTVEGKGNLDLQKKIFGLTDPLIADIQAWADAKFNEKKIGWINTFADYDTLMEYKNRFFPKDQDCLIMSINFPETEGKKLLEEFEPEDKIYGSIGLWDNLTKRQPEKDHGATLGYDLIGLESGGDFHTFHCHDLADELISTFNVEINNCGLINSTKKWKELTEYMNDIDNMFEPVPWYFVKVKLVTNN
jgi:hypothetical protein